jgi:hypothetical protein
MFQSIELFSGSKSVSGVLQKKGFKTFTVDFNPNLKPDLCIDILNLVCGDLPSSALFFWASPDCSKFSRAANQKHFTKKVISYRNYDYQPITQKAVISLSLLKKTIDLIIELKPAVWFIENPVGRIPHFAALRSFGHYRYCVNYKDWGFDYSKETYLFTNQLLPLPTKVQKRFGKGLRSIHSSYNRSIVPPDLIEFLIEHSNFQYPINSL